MPHHDCDHASTILPPQPASARDARQFVSDVLHRWCLTEDVADTAELLTSELVSNVVLHAGTDIRLSILHAGDDGVRVEVADAAHDHPVVHEPRREALGGRGLVLVDALSEDWGVEPRAVGKTVWFQVSA